MPYKTSRAETFNVHNTHWCPRSQLSLGMRGFGSGRIRAARHEVDPFLLNNLIVVLYRQTQSLAAAVIGRLAAVGSGYSRESGATEGGVTGAGARQCDKNKEELWLKSSSQVSESRCPRLVKAEGRRRRGVQGNVASAPTRRRYKCRLCVPMRAPILVSHSPCCPSPPFCVGAYHSSNWPPPSP